MRTKHFWYNLHQIIGKSNDLKVFGSNTKDREKLTGREHVDIQVVCRGETALEVKDHTIVDC